MSVGGRAAMRWSQINMLYFFPRQCCEPIIKTDLSFRLEQARGGCLADVDVLLGLRDICFVNRESLRAMDNLKLDEELQKQC